MVEVEKSSLHGNARKTSLGLVWSSTSSTMSGLEARRGDRAAKRAAGQAKAQGNARFKQQDPWMFSYKHQPNATFTR